MKKYFVAFALLIGLSSCAFHGTSVRDQNQHSTQVVLSEANYIVQDRVRGDASVVRIFGIGGLARKAIIADAREEMYRAANLKGKSRAIINENVDIKVSAFLIFYQKINVTVSGSVIEFQP